MDSPDLQKLNKDLADKSYVNGGAEPSQADMKAYKALSGALPDKAKLPHAWRWASHMAGLEKLMPKKMAALASGGNFQPGARGGDKGDNRKTQNQKGGTQNKGGNNKGQSDAPDLSNLGKGANLMGKLPNAKMGQVVTRFPPEPSGYMHIGHAKAAVLNSAYARMYNGKMILRFDDTNPSKEKQEFQESLLADAGRLKVKPDKISFTSDYFPQLIKYMTQALKEGYCYVDDTDVDTMRAERDAGTESKRRNQSVAENLAMWQEMQDGTVNGQKCVVRGKMNMKDPNKCLRDPSFFRCKVDVPHHRTGSEYKVYPIYDWACPIVDALEGVTHALRTTEYRDRAPLYSWVQDKVNVGKSEMYEFSKTQFKYTVLSKRKLTWFVDNNHVDGWTDPRFPTVQGMLRRGLSVDALREFVMEQGASKNTNLQEWDKLWVMNTKIIDKEATRYAAVTKENAVKISIAESSFGKEYQGKIPYIKSVPRHPKNGSQGIDLGDKILWFSNHVVVEQGDCSQEGAEIFDGEEITLLHWGNVICEKVHWGVCDKTKKKIVKSIDAKLHLEGSVKNTKKKMHWVSTLPEDANTPVVIREYDHLVTQEKLDDDTDFKSIINPQSIFETELIGDASLKTLNKGEIVQLERLGFFICDEVCYAPASSKQKERLVLVKIPDGKSKEMSKNLKAKVDPRKMQGASTADAAPAAAAGAGGDAGKKEPSEADKKKLQDLKDLVKKLKDEKAPEDQLKKVLEDMKKQKEVCGEVELSKAERKKLEKAQKAAAKAAGAK